VDPATNPPATSIWQGHRVRLRPVEPDDWPTFHAWDADDHVARQAFLVPLPRSAEATRQWTERAATRDPSGDEHRWVIADRDGAMVGTINTHGCDRRLGTFSYGIAVATEHGGRGYGAEAVRLVLRYYFHELGYQKVTVHVYEFNAASRALHERLGFVQEGRLRRMIYTAGRHWDTLVYGQTREEFEAEQAAKLPPFPAPDQDGDPAEPQD
jgi:RimJ/RimL family protein N-acetyltransferase